MRKALVAVTASVAVLAFVAVSSGQPALVNNRLALSRGCHASYLGRISPEWVAVDAASPYRSAEGTFWSSHLSSNDNPLTHRGHDWVGKLLLDSSFRGLLSDHHWSEYFINAPGDPNNGQELLETELDNTYFPTMFWPVSYGRVADSDRVWMWGRWVFDCGHPEHGWRTEIHPVMAIASTRVQPTTFPGDGVPSEASRTYVYIHEGDRTFHSASAARRLYTFDIPLPPRPSASAVLKTAVPQLPYGGPTPVMTVTADHVHVTIDLRNYPRTRPLRWGAVLAVGWHVPTASRTYRDVLVTFESVKVLNKHESVGSAEWKMWGNANGSWTRLLNASNVGNGATLGVNHSIKLTVPAGGNIRLQTTGWEADCDGAFGATGISKLAAIQCLLNGNDPLGVVSTEIPTPASNASMAPLTLSLGNPSRDYILKVRIAQINLFPAGTPHHKLVTLRLLSIKRVDGLGGQRVYLRVKANGSTLRFPATGTRTLPLEEVIAIPNASTSKTLATDMVFRMDADVLSASGVSLAKALVAGNNANGFGSGTHSVFLTRLVPATEARPTKPPENVPKRFFELRYEISVANA